MARFHRRRFKRKRPFKQPRWKKMVGIARTAIDTVANAGGKIGLIARAVRGIRNLVNSEAKFVDANATNTPDTTGVVNILTLIAQGTTDTTRIGNSVLSQSLDIKCTFVPSASATASFVRYIVFIDKYDGAGTAPTLANLLQATVSVQSFMNMDNSDRFVVLRNDVVPLTLVGNNRAVYREIHLKLTDLHVKYDGTTAAQASCTNNHIYFALLSNEAINTPSVSWVTRYRFVDN